MTVQGRVPPELARRLRTADRRARAAEARASAARAELRTTIAEAVAAGGSLRSVAAVIGRSHTAVAKWLKEEQDQ